MKISSQKIYLAILIFCLAPLGIAYYTEIFLEYSPCKLCIYQRIPFAIGAVIALACLFYKPLGRLALYLLALLFLVNGGIAFYHLGVEQAWFSGLSSCKMELEANSVEDLQNFILGNNQKSCSDITGTIFGISMALVNFIYNIFGFFGVVMIKRLQLINYTRG